MAESHGFIINGPIKAKMKNIYFLALATLIVQLSSCNNISYSPVREQINLSGTWRFAMDTSGVGIEQKWFSSILTDSVKLPGTMDENKKGLRNNDVGETMRLSRELMYAGNAWYKKEVFIPERWNGKNVRLILERTKPTKIWIDDIFMGENSDILTPQVYYLNDRLSSGKHTITILVNNGPGSVPAGITGSHSWTEHTQTNWNGIIGKLCLEAFNKDYIREVRIYPDIDKKSVLVKIKIFNGSENRKNAIISLNSGSWNTNRQNQTAQRSYGIKLNPGENNIELTHKIYKVQLWSEFEPALYKLYVSLKEGRNIIDKMPVDFGMRKFSTAGTQFAINGVKTFLRGKHDACVFPLTGHPPMDVDSWRKVFRIAKSYNINFYRFHSWTPPEEAFEAADIEGIYLQPELSFWGSLSKENPGLNDYLMRQGEKILDNYGNHASFVMFALGNELSGDQDIMNDFLRHFRSMDGRRLMAYGSNNFLGYHGHAEGEDYYAGCRIGPDVDTTYKTHIRASFSFADAYDGGYLNGRYPSTNINYSGAIKNCKVPAIGTEVGQYQIYPDYNEIRKYTGVLKPWNFLVFRERLKKNNLSDQAIDFFKASGALSVICYRADIEMALRTPGFGGFHLLDLQDFPGQGTALVGILDAFMESKGLITPEEFGHFCNRVVPLLIMDKYCWVNNEKFKAIIQVANYSQRSMIGQPVKWELKNSKGTIIEEGERSLDIQQGGLTNVTDLDIDLSKIIKAEKTTLCIKLTGTPYENSYPLWIYPSDADTSVPADIIISTTLDKNVLQKLYSGSKVLLFPDHKNIQDQSVGGLFTPDYWNYRMFRGISEANKKPVSPGTMSILTDPGNPLFADFPTEFYTDWQWWPIIKSSRPFILDNTSKSYKPVVQVVDNIERNHKLGLIFEFATGKGKLLICMSDLKKIEKKPEARQLYSSILKYMESDSFNPDQKISEKELIQLFESKAPDTKMTDVKNLSY